MPCEREQNRVTRFDSLYELAEVPQQRFVRSVTGEPG
jgi:hypothetical protein